MSRASGLRPVAALSCAVALSLSACPVDPAADASSDAVGDAPVLLDALPDVPCPTILEWVQSEELAVSGSGFDLQFTGCPRSIAVRATACDGPVPGVPISGSISGRPEGACLLDSPALTTGSDGTAAFIVRGLPNDLGGECALQVCTGPGACLDASLHETCSAYPRLVVAFGVPPALDGIATLGMAWLYLPDASGHPACADLDPSALPDPADRKGPVSVLTTVQFPVVKGLAKAGDLVPVTVVAQASAGTGGPVLATGCVEAVTDFCTRTFLEIRMQPVTAR